MKKSLFFALPVLLLLFVAFKPGDDISLKSFKLLSLSEVKPQGWLKSGILRDMKKGYLSVLPQIQPTLQHAVFGPEKVTNFSIDKNGDYTIRKATWWWGEHEGYYADLLVRSAFLTGDKDLIKKADSVVHYALSNQEEDGYIGIYQKGHRLSLLKGENGELWSQSRMLNALIAYYEFTGKKEVLEAVQKAAKLTMSHYGEGKMSYFHIKGNDGGGTAHGLMYIETMEMLYRLTGDKAYADFAFWLYNDYSTSNITNNRDNQMDSLLQKELLFKEHGAHIMEHMRAVLWLSTLSKEPQFQTAFDNIFYKLGRSTVPGGALVSDELVQKRVGDPNFFYEYCTMTERMISTFSGLQKSGRASYADDIERLVFNAAQGARFADLSSTSYLSIDNRFEAIPWDNNIRFQHSASNNPACCNLNAGKLYPYFVSNLWMKTQDEKGLVATAFGPSTVSTSLNGRKVTINEVTEYPFENSITFRITVDKPTTFPVIFRKPVWAQKATVKAGNARVNFRDGYYIVIKEWKTGDQISANFDSKVEAVQAVNGDTYLKNGALVYSLPVATKLDTVKTFRKGFYTFNLHPQDRTLAERIFKEYKLVGTKALDYRIARNPAARKDYPWDVPYFYLSAQFDEGGKVKTEKLYPMGSTILRKVTFPAK